MHPQRHRHPIQQIAFIHAAYYLITGLWPLVHLRSFLRLTGPKTDVWLVKTVGILVAVIGTVMARAAIRHTPSTEITLLAVGSAVALAGIDVVYVARRRIAPIYLTDALAELILVGGWIWAWKRR